MLIKKYRKCSFVFDDAIEFYHGVPVVLVFTQRNAGCKTWNNDHHALYMVSETACHVFPYMIDYINLWLTIAISYHVNIHTRRKELLYEHNFSSNNMFWNVFFKYSWLMKSPYPKLWEFEKRCRSINLNLSDHVRVFLRKNMTIAVDEIKKESMFYLLLYY